MIRIKQGVDLSLIREPMFDAVCVVARLLDQIHRDCVITSGADGRHMPGSKHYTGEALDFRLRHVPELAARAVATLAARALGPDYDVIYESADGVRWLHVEYDPKEPSGRENLQA